MEAIAPPGLTLFSEKVVLGAGGGRLRIAPARVEIEEERIVEVVEHSRTELVSNGRGLVDLGSSLLTPAFVNAHTHLAMAAFRGVGTMLAFRGNVVEDLYYRLERDLSADDVRAFTRLGAYECLLAGVGLVFDHYYQGHAVADALGEVGLAGVVAPTLQDLSGPGQGRWETELATTIELASNPILAKRGVFAAFGPHATDTVSIDLWQRLTRLAAEHHLPVHAHLAQSVEEYERAEARHGCSPVGILERTGLLESSRRPLLVHALFVDDADLSTLTRAQPILGFCPCSQARFAFPVDLERWNEVGIDFALGTDCASSNDSMSLQKELRAAAGLSGAATARSAAHEDFCRRGGRERARAVGAERGRQVARFEPLEDPERLLGAVWSVPGSLHPAVRCGVIEPGALANLAVWNLSHPAFWPALDPLRALAYGDTVGALESLMVAGRWIGQRGHLTSSVLGSDRYREATREAEERLRARLSRV